MWNYDLLAALEAVCRTGSFERAARSLHITQSAVSQRLRALEENVGQRVLHRGPPIVATKIGERLLAHVQHVSLLESELESNIDLSGQSQTGRIAIAVNADSIALWLLDALSEVLDRKGIFLEILVEDEEHTHELLERGQVIGCVSARSSSFAGSDRTPLGTMRYMCVATPAFVKQYFKDGFNAESASKAPGLLFNRKDLTLDRFLQKVFGKDQLSLQCHFLPSAEKFNEFIGRGWAYGLLSHLQVGGLKPKKGLVDLTPGHHLDTPLYWHGVRARSPILTLVQESIIKTAGKKLVQA